MVSIKDWLSDPEQYINFVHYQVVDSVTCLEDLKEWMRWINIGCNQLDKSKYNKSNQEQKHLEEIRQKGVSVLIRLQKRLNDLDTRI